MAIHINLDNHTVEDVKAIQMMRELGFAEEEIQDAYDRQKKLDAEKESDK